MDRIFLAFTFLVLPFSPQPSFTLPDTDRCSDSHAVLYDLLDDTDRSRYRIVSSSLQTTCYCAMIRTIQACRLSITWRAARNYSSTACGEHPYRSRATSRTAPRSPGLTTDTVRAGAVRPRDRLCVRSSPCTTRIMWAFRWGRRLDDERIRRLHRVISYIADRIC